MKKSNKSTKVLFMIVSILLCSAILTSTILSATFAKYVTEKSDSMVGNPKQWLTIEDMLSQRDEYDSGDIASGTDNAGQPLQIIAPGTSGTLAKFTLKKEPEVRHKIELKVNFTIPEVEDGETPVFGYEDFIGGEDYFPMLITVNRKDGNNVVGTPLYFYMTMQSGETTINTVDDLFAAIEKAIYQEQVEPAPSGWATESITYSVDWTWFYNDDEIDASNLSDTIKTALKAYQDPLKDTLLGAAILNRSDLDNASAHIAELKEILAQIKAGTLTQDEAMAALNQKLSDMNNEPEKTYQYEKIEEYPINWRGLRNSGYMIAARYNTGNAFQLNINGEPVSFGDMFSPRTGDDYVITAVERTDIGGYNTDTKKTLQYFYYGSIDSNGGNGATVQPKAGELYEYTFAARSHSKQLQGATLTNTPYVGLVFAMDEATKQPYYLFGVFHNAVSSKSALSAVYGVAPANLTESNALGGFYSKSHAVDDSTLLPSQFTGANARYCSYKITYEGIERTTSGNTESGIRVKFYYKDKTSGEYLPYKKTDGTEIALDLWGARISLGIHARTRYEGSGSSIKILMQTVEIVNAKIRQVVTVSSKEDAYKNLLARAESLVSTAESKTFMFHVGAEITAEQVQ